MSIVPTHGWAVVEKQSKGVIIDSTAMHEATTIIKFLFLMQQEGACEIPPDSTQQDMIDIWLATFASAFEIIEVQVLPRIQETHKALGKLQ